MDWMDGDPFDNNFHAFYNQQGLQAGTYTLDNGNWSMQ
jgi:hypothetical protein